MTALVPAIKAIVRDELTTVRPLELGIVTETFTNEGGSGDNNLAVNVRLQDGALELQHVPVAVSRLGFSLAPQVGDLAVIGFVSGDVNGGVILGFVYDEQNRAPDATATELVYEVRDEGDSDSRRLEVLMPNGNTVTVKDETVTVTMGGTSLVVEADGAITMEAAGDLDLKAQGAVNIESTGGDVTIKGINVTAEGQAQATLKGAMTSIAGMTSFSAS